MPLIELPISIQQFSQLPRNASFKYEYIEKRAFLSPRPKHYHAVLDLRPMTASDSVTVVHLKADAMPDLQRLFAGAFRYIQPFGCLDDDARLEAARQSLERTRSGGDGPFIERASFVARDRDNLVGAILITLLPDGDPCEFDSFQWKEAAPADCIERRLGRPHLTWIFVSAFEHGHGIGSALLAASVRELLAVGYSELLSTFMLGNESSMLWHWRNGFRLLPHPGSFRLLKQRWQALSPPADSG